MTLTNCPMCDTAVPTEGVIKTCAGCGADLTRWLPKPPKLSAVAVPVAAAMAAPPVIATSENYSGDARLGKGILGAVAGAVVGSVIMFAFFLLVGFRFPLMGVGTGFLTGLGARKLNQGGDGEKLGMFSAGIAALSVGGTLYLMYGEDWIWGIISVIVSTSVAYRTASR